MNAQNQGPLIRYEGNPILVPGDMPFRCYSVMNAGAIVFNGEVLLLLRVERYERTSHLHIAKSKDGIHFEVCPDEVIYPLSESEKRYGAAHRFDMRVTLLEGVYYIYHASWFPANGHFGGCLGLATTEDFVEFKPFPHLSQPANRNGVLFPEKIGGLYARLDRPQDINGRGRMWVSYSPDLEFWGRSMPLDLPIYSWGAIKNGSGTTPVKTEHGWLEIYHATTKNCSTENYHLGVALLDLDDPSRVIAAPAECILAAEKPYECMGQTPNAIFTCGAVEMPDGAYYVYYGAADTCMCLATTTVQELVDYCLASK